MTTETEQSTAIAVAEEVRPVNLMRTSPFATREAFQLATDMAVNLSRSSIIPDLYRDQYLHQGEWKTNPDAAGNCFIAIELANRLGASPLVVIQNVDVIYGRPGLRGTFIVALIESSAKFTETELVCTHAAEITALEAIKKKLTDQLGEAVGDSVTALIEKIAAVRKDIAKIRKADDYGYHYQARRVSDGKLCVGPTITWEMVKAEGWDTKKDSKWKSIPEQMFQYRAPSFWSRLYASDITLGLHETSELEDALEGEFTRVPSVSERTRTLETALDSVEVVHDESAPGERTQPADAAAAQTAEPRPGRKPATRRRKAEPTPAPADNDPVKDEDADDDTGGEPAAAEEVQTPEPAKEAAAPAAAAPAAGNNFALE